MRVVGEHGGTLTAHVVSVETGLGKQRVHSLHTASDTLVVNQVVVSCNDGMGSKMTSGMLRLGKALGGSDGEQSVRDTIHEVRDLFSGSK